MDSNLYPDLAAAGSLAAALQQVASDLGVDLVAVPGGWGARVSAYPTASAPERQPLSVHIAAKERSFRVTGWRQGTEVITGRTSDNTDIVQAAVAWGNGERLRQIREHLAVLALQRTGRGARTRTCRSRRRAVEPDP
ncbi:hypothetical protein ACFQVC_21695 [Streptomyces monticola]|uniref:Uncharacterized protein n=1 Tax=Streptomyces monticola TaxID=2666263 RepID=A0ABW2JN46_9ACTN